MIELLAAIGFIGILAHIAKSWIDWADVRNVVDLMPSDFCIDETDNLLLNMMGGLLPALHVNALLHGK